MSREDNNNRDRGDRDGGRRGPGGKMKRAKKKICSFCIDKAMSIDYKDINKLRKNVTERGKILPRRISGNCAKHQRQLTAAVKRARNIALLPFSTE